MGSGSPTGSKDAPSKIAQQVRAASNECAIELSRAMPEPFTEAITRCEWGRMLADTGDSAGVREQLCEALTLFRRLDAEPFIERSERTLVGHCWS